jgi:hypothetical protein
MAVPADFCFCQNAIHPFFDRVMMIGDKDDMSLDICYERRN